MSYIIDEYFVIVTDVELLFLEAVVDVAWGSQSNNEWLESFPVSCETTMRFPIQMRLLDVDVIYSVVGRIADKQKYFLRVFDYFQSEIMEMLAKSFVVIRMVFVHFFHFFRR